MDTLEGWNNSYPLILGHLEGSHKSIYSDRRAAHLVSTHHSEDGNRLPCWNSVGRLDIGVLANPWRIHGAGIIDYIWLIFMVNVGTYTIHGYYTANQKPNKKTEVQTWQLVWN